MRDSFKPLSHPDASRADDAALCREAGDHLKRHPALQLVAELYAKLRESRLDWWSAAYAREEWSPHLRMEWLRDRIDVRQTITCKLTGLPKNTARHKSPTFQAELIESVIANGDISDEAFDAAFDAKDLVVYGSPLSIWDAFRSRLPWEEDAPAHQRLIAWLFRALLAERPSIDGTQRHSILGAVDVRAAIDASAWQRYIPVELRVAVDQARIKAERTRPREPYRARNELAIVTPEIIAQSIPLVELQPVIAVADAALALSSAVAESAPPISEDRSSGAYPLRGETHTLIPAVSSCAGGS